MSKWYQSVICIASITLFLPFFVKAQVDSVIHDMDYYVAKGIKNSPLLKDYSNQLLSNRLDSLIVRARNQPQINGNVQALYYPNYGSFGYDQAITNGGNYAAQISATQNILNRKSIMLQYKSVGIAGQSIANTAKLSEHDLRHSIISGYIGVWSDQSQIENAFKVRKLIDEEDKYLKLLVGQGTMKLSSYYSFMIEKQTDDFNLKQLRIQFSVDLMALNIICGINDSATSVKLRTPTIIQNGIKFNYYNTPIFLKYRIDSLQIINGKDIINAAYRPHLAWNADAGFLSSTPLFYQYPGISLGISLVLPIYDGKQQYIEYQRLGIQEMTRLNYQSYSHNQYNLQYVTLTNELNSSRELTNTLKSQMELSDNLIQMSKSELNKGDISITDFVLNLRNEIDIHNNLNSNQVKMWQIENDINYMNW